MLRFMFGSLRANSRRLLLAAIATIVGAAFVTSTLILSDTLQENLEQRVVGGASRLDAVISTDNQLRKLQPSTLARVQAIPGVQKAEGVVSGNVTVLGSDGRPARAQPIGISITMRTDLLQGRVPIKDDEVLIAESTARELFLGIGDTFSVLDSATGEPIKLRITGMMSVAGQGQLALNGGFGLTPATAKRLTGQESFSQIYIVGSDPERLKTAIAGVVPAGPYSVLTGREYAELQAAGSGVDPKVLSAGLVTFALVALLVAMFVVYNTYTVLIVQRTQELALARCVGASRRQIFAVVLAEATLIGAIAAAAGALLGLGAASLALPLMNYYGADIPGEAFTVAPQSILIGLMAGVIASAGAAFFPARSATRVPPIAALRTQYEPRDTPIGRCRTIVAVSACLVGALCALAGLVSDGRQYPLGLVGLGGAVFFIGVVASGPLLVRSIARMARSSTSALFGVPGKLGAINVARNPRRSATTVLALVIGATLSTGVSVITASLSSSVDVGVGQALPFDYTISPPGSDTTVPREVAAQLRSRPETISVAEIRESFVLINGQRGLLSTREGGANPTVLRGSLDDFGPGKLALLPDRASELGVDVGGAVQVEAGGRRMTMVVSAIVTGPAIPRTLISPNAFDGLFPGRGDGAVLVGFDRDVTAEVSRMLVEQATADVPTVRIASAYAARDRLTETLSQVTTLVTSLLALVVFISLVGITNTISLSILERRRESATLRALGLSSRGLRLMMLVEASLFGIIGGAIGAILGSTFGLAAARVIKDDVVLTIPIGTVAVIVIGGGIAAVLAALIPTRGATRRSIVEGISQG